LKTIGVALTWAEEMLIVAASVPVVRFGEAAVSDAIEPSSDTALIVKELSFEVEPATVIVSPGRNPAKAPGTAMPVVEFTILIVSLVPLSVNTVLFVVAAPVATENAAPETDSVVELSAFGTICH
jgi:hypothetical protein